MCTLAVAFQQDRRWPLVVAANRDERLGRAAEGWALRAGRDGVRAAWPRDLVAGGTWIGLSARGVFAALTNYHAPQPWYPDPDRRSRGELVELALAEPDADGARAELERRTPEAWNPFHLVVADTRNAYLWWFDGERSAIEPLGPGLHVVTETDREGRGARAELVRARWPLDGSVERLRDLLAVHAGAAPEPAAATCIHADPDYGTRSSTVLRLAPDLAASELFVAEARPCLGGLEDRSDLVAALARSRPGSRTA
jgi:uncharacterized protein with NRDE domain